ncbi:MAG: hypothetical protein KBG20_18075 [Caldilineaceae bacterium]|nr:hypothetical protein [Caldilineaceae bacterium]MBP8124770.1 hypothetical protein [Caldilineaceae bacterium]MBP9074219.1 hypothetical protein [Caldilineaceae bacterium]
MKKVWRQRRWLAWALGMFALGTVLVGLGMAEPSLAQQAAPGFTNPVDGQAVSGDVTIQGTAVIDSFQKYELHFKLEPSGNDAFIYFDGATQPVVNGQLGIWRASGLPAGTYSLRLRVVKADGNYAEYYTRNVALNLGPVPTPTSDQPTPTPIPVVTATFTPPPAQPTAAPVVVDQPAGVVDLTPTPEPVAVQVDSASSGGAADSANPDTAAAPESSGAGSLIARELGEAVAVDRLRSEFFGGMRSAAGIVALLLAIFGGKALYAWYRTREPGAGIGD